MNLQRERIFDLSMGLQNATSPLLRKSNEVEDSRNIRYNSEIGSAVGREGFTPTGDPFSSGLPSQGEHTANFREGPVLMVAVNNTDETATEVKVRDATTLTWTTIISDLPANSQVFFKDYLNEVYISGFSPSGVPFQPRNVDALLDVSTTRNLLNCPYPYYFVEYLGLLYAVNVYFDSTRYPDRVYKSSPPTGAVTFIQGAQSGTLTTLKVDSVRYLKPGMAIDVYGKGSSTKKHDLTITEVDKTANTISFASTSINVVDNDEIYLDGRFSKLGIVWNTDYPTKDRAEFLAIQAGVDGSNEITAAAKSANRLFLFTDNSSTRWDGSNLVTFNTSVGCVSQKVLKNIDDDWLLWVDRRGRVYARNESQGEQQYISRGIYNKLLSHFTPLMLQGAHAATFGNQYKLYLGEFNNEIVRSVYDFDSNTWTIESISRELSGTVIANVEGQLKPVLFSATGDVYVDELGDDDDGIEIPYMIQIGSRNMGHEGKKAWYGVYIYSQYAKGLSVKVALGKGQFKTVGYINEDEELIKFEQLPESSMINIRISGRYRGPAPSIEGMVIYFTVREDFPQNG